MITTTDHIYNTSTSHSFIHSVCWVLNMGQKLCYMLGKNPVNKSRYSVSLQGAPSSIEICIFKKQTQSIWWTILLTAKPKLVEAIWGLGRLCRGSSTWIWKIEDLPGEGKKSIPCGLNNIRKYLMGDPNSHLLCILSTQHRGNHAEDNKYLLKE